MNEQQWLKELLQRNGEDVKLSEKQIKILQAAIEMFAEKGYAATSTSEIAKKAGVAEGTIFRHYKTKKDLLLAIVTPTLFKSVAPFLAKEFVKEVFESQYQSYEDFIRALLKNRYQFVKKYLPAVRVFWQETTFHPEIKEQVQHVFTTHIYQKFKRIVEHFQEKGELAAIPADSVIRMTITTIAGFLLARFIMLPDYDWDDEAEMERTIQFLMHGLAKKMADSHENSTADTKG
ncbi:TetR/AcrR family transcriptional regulator [Parageobacillus thermoglucosidasius]|uniref:TetR/AcrR family transcriptional regulator n=1 Tax=Parageobacillus thermoglucosidasius TaxID=1426 RepID=UPI000E3AA679|nr:TetR/AcrR family transcriptional regulator [Parageobacillus thermoglucosidasius]REK54844.1 MAG: TetR family transcriptional regulator [Geobacillus sp.]BDG33056.1 TetR family transcriptional regulator [Parageobacillus thermoglucosidasius]